EPITAVRTSAPGNGAALGGVKVSTENAWFAARPSGTEDVYKIYAESFKGPEHLAKVQEEARSLVSAALGWPAARREERTRHTGRRRGRSELDRAAVADRSLALELGRPGEPVAVVEERDRPVAVLGGPGHLGPGGRHAGLRHHAVPVGDDDGQVGVV